MNKNSKEMELKLTKVLKTKAKHLKRVWTEASKNWKYRNKKYWNQ